MDVIKIIKNKKKRQREREAQVWVCEATVITFHKSVDL